MVCVCLLPAPGISQEICVVIERLSTRIHLFTTKHENPLLVFVMIMSARKVYALHEDWEMMLSFNLLEENNKNKN